MTSLPHNTQKKNFSTFSDCTSPILLPDRITSHVGSTITYSFPLFAFSPWSEWESALKLSFYNKNMSTFYTQSLQKMSGWIFMIQVSWISFHIHLFLIYKEVSSCLLREYRAWDEFGSYHGIDFFRMAWKLV